jgi:hypothetical protein
MFINNEQVTGSFTFAAEGSPDPASPNYYGKLSHPSSHSGVTIGAGYDMAERSESEVKGDLMAAGASADLAERISKGAKLRGAAAHNFVETNRPTLVIHDIQILRNLFAKTYPHYIARARDSFHFHATTFKACMSTYGSQYKDAVPLAWESLYPAIRVIAIDFVYQGFGKQQSGYGKPMHFCMANDFDWLIDYIEHSPLRQYEKGRRRASYLRLRKDSEEVHYCKAMQDS